VRYLVGRQSPAAFVHFVHTALRSGYDQALREVYAMNDVGQLERLWRSDSARLAR
jgi:hypothetical protein